MFDGLLHTHYHQLQSSSVQHHFCITFPFLSCSLLFLLSLLQDGFLSFVVAATDASLLSSSRVYSFSTSPAFDLLVGDLH